MSSELEPNEIVGERYRLERRLGTGGMGVVWLAQQTKTKKWVALKLVKQGGSPEQAKRLHREARASSVIRHPNVREVYDVLEAEDGSPIIVMEYLEGRPLSALLAEEPKLSIERAAEILLPVISAVGTAHALGIVHRDLKPDNIFMVEQPAKTIKVVDFGIAKLTATEGDAAETAGITSTGSIVGTPHYMAPEQVFGERRIDYRADVWALGLLMYRMLSGVLPTEAENVGQVMKIIVSRGIPSLIGVEPSVPPEIAKLIDKMLVRNAKSRLSDLTLVLKALRAYASSDAPSFEGPAIAVAADSGDSEGPPTLNEETVDEGRESGRPVTGGSSRSALETGASSRRLWLGAGAVVVATAGLVFATTRPSSDSRASESSSTAPSVPTTSDVRAEKPAVTEAPTASAGAALPSVTPSAAESASPAASSEKRPPSSATSAKPKPSATSAPAVDTASPTPTVQVQTTW